MLGLKLNRVSKTGPQVAGNGRLAPLQEPIDITALLNTVRWLRLQPGPGTHATGDFVHRDWNSMEILLL